MQPRVNNEKQDQFNHFMSDHNKTIKQTLGLPPAQGLYDPENEHDSCGVGFLCHLKGKKSHDIIKGALDMNVCMEHRGGCGFDEATGDGAGLFIQLPHKFFKSVTPELNIELPNEGEYAGSMR